MANINDNVTSSESQCSKIAMWMNGGGKLTSLDALRLFGCARLASRINDLKNRGWVISTRKIQVESGKWVSEYWVDKENRRVPQEIK